MTCIFVSAVSYYGKTFIKGEPWTALGSQQRGHEFLHPQYPTTEDFYKVFYEGRTFDSSGFSTEGTSISAFVVSHCWKVLKRKSSTDPGSLQKEPKFLQARLFARVSSCILLSDQLSFICSFNYHYVGKVCGSRAQWSQAGIKYTCTNTHTHTKSVEKSTKGYNNASRQKPQKQYSAYSRLTTTQGIWLP